MSTKEFDCVDMKHQIQQRILEEFRALTPADQQRRTEEMIRADPLLARIWDETRRPAQPDSTAQPS